MRGETQDQAQLLQAVASSHNYEQEKASTSARSHALFGNMGFCYCNRRHDPFFGVLPDVYRGTLWDPEKTKPHITTILRAASVGAW